MITLVALNFTLNHSNVYTLLSGGRINVNSTKAAIMIMVHVDDDTLLRRVVEMPNRPVRANES